MDTHRTHSALAALTRIVQAVEAIKDAKQLNDFLFHPHTHTEPVSGRAGWETTIRQLCERMFPWGRA